MVFKTAFSLASPAGREARLSILIFHRVLAEPDPLFPDEPDATRFDQILKWATAWFNFLPLDEAARCLREGSLPARAAAITFDDGYADNYTQALPILQRHGVSATFFVASGFLDGGRMWNDTVIEALRNTTLSVLDTGLDGLRELSLGDIDAKRHAMHRLLAAVKHMQPDERLETVERIASHCAVTLPDDLMMSSAQLRALRAAGMIIGAHTVSHPILAVTSLEQAREEIESGKAHLEQLLGEPVRLFAYPNGKPGSDYRPVHVNMVRELGFEAAVSTHWGANTRDSDPYQLLRFTPWDRNKLRFGARLLQNLRRPAIISQ